MKVTSPKLIKNTQPDSVQKADNKPGFPWVKLIISLAIPLAVGGLTALLIGDSSRVYESLVQPPLAPPPWLFPVVWTILFILMGVAFFLVWTSDCSSTAKRNAFIAYGIQLAINALWSPLFFLFGLYSVSSAVIILLMIALTVTIDRFSRCSVWAGRLLLPYLFWTAFAAYLNISIALLN